METFLIVYYMLREKSDKLEADQIMDFSLLNQTRKILVLELEVEWKSLFWLQNHCNFASSYTDSQYRYKYL